MEKVVIRHPFVRIPVQISVHSLVHDECEQSCNREQLRAQVFNWNAIPVPAERRKLSRATYIGRRLWRFKNQEPPPKVFSICVPHPPTSNFALALLSSAKCSIPTYPRESKGVYLQTARDQEGTVFCLVLISGMYAVGHNLSDTPP